METISDHQMETKGDLKYYQRRLETISDPRRLISETMRDHQ